MKNTVLFSVFLVFLDGVFGQAAEEKKVSVLEGDSVTLHTSLTETDKIDLMMWMYGSEGSIIAKLNGKSQQISLYDVDDGRFGDRLQLDNQTGSLSISDIRTKHSGDYQLKIISNETSYMTFNLTVHDVFFAGLTNSKEGETVILQTGVSELQKYDVISWMFGPLSPETFMAEINIPLQKISYSEDERLTDRLWLNNQTGSLTIMDSRTTDTGVYQLQITNSKETSYKRYNVFVTVPEPGLPLGTVVLICFALFAVAAAATVITVCYKYSIPKCFKCNMCSEASKDEMTTNEVTERDSIPLHTVQTGIAEPQRYEQILWRFGPKDSHIAQIPLRNRETLPEDDERFTIDLLYVDSLQFSEEEDITLDTGVSELQRDDKILWSFESEDNIIAKKDGDIGQVLTDADDGRFRDRLQMDDQTGSLTITNTKSTDSGVYHLQISSRNKASFKKFTVCLNVIAGDSINLNTDVTEQEDENNDTGIAEISQKSNEENNVSVIEGDRAELNTDVSELQRDSLILWMFGPRDSLIAKADMENNKISTYDGADGRFRDRLEVDHQTGSLSITNATNTDSGLYKLKIICSRETKYKQFSVTVCGNRETNREDAVESYQSENVEETPLIRTYSGTSV